MKYHKLYILIGLLIILSSLNYKPKLQSVYVQTVFPSCTEKEDCKVQIQQGYCGVQYDCVAGKCYHSFEACPIPPEICYWGLDEDQDDLIDCKDSDCWNSPYCSCVNIDFNDCRPGRCYCESGKPKWVVSKSEDTTNSWCQCM